MVVEPATDTSSRESAIVGVLRTMRPHQWVKNAFVLAPLIFAQAFWELDLLFRGLAATGLFCLMAGTVYLINDITDREEDRRHPTKRHRPIASGQLSVQIARRVAWGMGIFTLMGAAAIDPGLAGVLAAYLVMNLAYSNVLKEWAFVDVGIIAVGFVLRVLAGSAAVDVFLSVWLVLCTFLLATFLGLGKRCHELALVRAGRIDEARKGWRDYGVQQLETGLFFVGALTTAAYTIYALTASLPDQPLRTQNTPFTDPLIPVTIPLVVLGLARFYQLTQRDIPASPTDQMLRDPIIIVTVLVWGAALLGLAVL